MLSLELSNSAPQDIRAPRLNTKTSSREEVVNEYFRHFVRVSGCRHANQELVLAAGEGVRRWIVE